MSSLPYFQIVQFAFFKGQVGDGKGGGSRPSGAGDLGSGGHDSVQLPPKAKDLFPGAG